MTESPEPSMPQSAVPEPALPEPALPEPVASEPVLPEPVASERYSSDPYASDPYASDPYASDPYASDPRAQGALASGFELPARPVFGDPSRTTAQDWSVPHVHPSDQTIPLAAVNPVQPFHLTNQSSQGHPFAPQPTAGQPQPAPVWSQQAPPSWPQSVAQAPPDIAGSGLGQGVELSEPLRHGGFGPDGAPQSLAPGSPPTHFGAGPVQPGAYQLGGQPGGQSLGGQAFGGQAFGGQSFGGQGAAAHGAGVTIQRGGRSVVRMGAALVLATLALGLFGGFLGGLAGGWVAVRAGLGGGDGTSLASGDGSPVVAAGPPTVLRPQGSVAEVAARVLPSVVQIEVVASDGEASGSGFIIDKAGHILTNNHVVSAGRAATLTVVFQDGTRKSATVVGEDANYDLAVIKADTGNRAPLVLGDSDKAVVGDAVIAIGAPLGLQGTVTTGIISAKNRPVTAGDGGADTSFIDALQTDAAINPGNSGGPLVDATGAVIGVNSAIARAQGSTGNIGLGFAIPSNQAKRTAHSLITTGKATYPVLGVQLDRAYTGGGAKVSTVPVNGYQPITKGGPADKGGVQAGDVVVALNGHPITTSTELIVGIRAHTPGDTVQLSVIRAGREMTLSVTLASSSG